MRTNGNRFEGTLAFACLLLTLVTVYRTESKISEHLRAQASAEALLDEHKQDINHDSNHNGRKLMRGGVQVNKNNKNESDAPLSPSHQNHHPKWSDLGLLAPPLPPPPPRHTNNISLTTVDLEPLRVVDYEYYTLRILTWKRPEFLAASVIHHSQCPGVQQIQIVWSIEQEQEEDGESNIASTIPQEVLENPKVVVEKRTTNSLNDRFDILDSTPTTTLGILVMDDDLIYTCEALDMGFFMWTQHPNKMVTYAPRRHKVNVTDGSWRYAWHKKGKFSLGLTSTAFLHRGYLYQYTYNLPRDIYKYVHLHKNCEDIAMSLWVSYLTNGEMPLAVDEWGIKGRLQLATADGYQGIKTSSSNHLQDRSICLDWFSKKLGLKGKWKDKEYSRLSPVRVLVGVVDIVDVDANNTSTSTLLISPRLEALQKKQQEWIQLDDKAFAQAVLKMRNSLKPFLQSRNLSSEGFG